MKTTCKQLVVAATWFTLAAGAAAADVVVKDAWVRGTVPGQKATGAFMEITSKSDASLVGAATPAAGVAEIHEMKMDGGVMKMRAIDRLELPAGKPTRLAPGSYHVMLMDLKQPLKKGDVVPLTLRIEGSDRKVQNLELGAEVRDLAAAAPEAGEHKH